MKLRVTPSNNGRTVGNAGNIKSAEGHLGQVTEQHYNIQQSRSAAYGDYSGDLAVAQATQQGFQAAASVVDTVASGVKVYQDGRDNEEISKMYSDVGLFHEQKMRELASDGEASADEKMDSYNEAMEDYKENILNGSKLTSRGIKKAKSTFDVMTHDMKNKYATGQYQKDHISDYKSIQDAKFQNIQDIAVSVGQDGDPNGFMKVMNMAEELDKDLQNPTFQTMYGDKAEEIVRTKQMDVVSKYFKSLPPELAEQAMTNPDVEAGLVALFGEATYAEFKDDITILMAKKAAKEEAAVNKLSADTFDKMVGEHLHGKHFTMSDIDDNPNLTQKHKNTFNAKIVAGNKKFQKSLAIKTEEENAIKSGRLYSLSNKKRNQIYENNFDAFRNASVNQQLEMMAAYKRDAREYPKLYMEHLNTSVMSSDPEQATKSLQVLQTMSAADRSVPLTDTTQSMLSTTSIQGFSPEAMLNAKDILRKENEFLQRGDKIPVTSSKQFETDNGKTITEYITDTVDISGNPMMKQELLKVYQISMHANGGNTAIALERIKTYAANHYSKMEDGSERTTKYSVKKVTGINLNNDEIQEFAKQKAERMGIPEDFILQFEPQAGDFVYLRPDGGAIVDKTGRAAYLNISTEAYDDINLSRPVARKTNSGRTGYGQRSTNYDEYTKPEEQQQTKPYGGGRTGYGGAS